MAKKESLKKEEDFLFPDIPESAPPAAGAIKSKIAGFTAKIFGIVKLLLGLCLLPFVYGATLSFLNQLYTLDPLVHDYLWAGLAVFLIIYLFIWEPKVIYAKGQRILEIVFKFFKPLVRVAPYLLPIYSLILLCVYQISLLFVKSPKLIYDFIFIFGISIGLHLVFSAKSLRTKQGDFLKGNYIFGFSFVYIINVIIFAFCFNLIFEKYSFVAFCNDSFQLANKILSAVFKQLFL